MRIRSALGALAAVTILAAPAAAEETPRPGPVDARIRSVDYDPAQVVRLTGVLRTATQIRFAADETVLHVAMGDGAGWEVAPERNLLFAKPTALRPPTNLLVTTERAGGERRHYMFELTVRRRGTTRAAPRPVYVVQFRYPDQARAALAKALDAEAAALEARIVAFRLERAMLEGPRNLAYELQGSALIAPTEVTDNGRFTMLRFPGAQEVPAVYVVQPDGSESLVPFDVRGQFLVVHRTAAQLRLRRGREVLCIFNLAWPPPPAPRTGTAAADVQRAAGETR